MRRETVFVIIPYGRSLTTSSGVGESSVSRVSSVSDVPHLSREKGKFDIDDVNEIL
jgi:hypothetical protein